MSSSAIYIVHCTLYRVTAVIVGLVHCRAHSVKLVIVTSNAVTLWDVGQHYYLRLDTTVPFIGILTAAIDLLFGGLGYTCISIEAMPVNLIGTHHLDSCRYQESTSKMEASVRGSSMLLEHLLVS